jgi:hypothetical protein
MIIQIPKGTSANKVRSILKKNSKKESSKKLKAFFGKLPNIEDGVTFQKKIRNELK